MNYQHAYNAIFTDFQPALHARLCARIEEGRHDCHSCGQPLTRSSAAMVGRFFFTRQHIEICICRKCRRKAGSFKKAARRAAEMFRDEHLPDKGRLVDMDQIHPATGHC